jgi:hypothetical protein
MLTLRGKMWRVSLTSHYKLFTLTLGLIVRLMPYFTGLATNSTGIGQVPKKHFWEMKVHETTGRQKVE